MVSQVADQEIERIAQALEFFGFADVRGIVDRDTSSPNEHRMADKGLPDLKKMGGDCVEGAHKNLWGDESRRHTL